MLYPLVESTLPEELLRVWQGHSTSAGNIDTRDRLSRLMSFLQIKVVTEERIAMAVDGFNINVTAKELKEKKEERREEETIVKRNTIGSRIYQCQTYASDIVYFLQRATRELHVRES